MREAGAVGLLGPVGDIRCWVGLRSAMVGGVLRELKGKWKVREKGVEGLKGEERD